MKTQDSNPGTTRNVPQDTIEKKKKQKILWIVAFATIIGLLLVFAIIVLVTNSLNPKVTPTPLTDFSLIEIQNRGVLRVATAADYPPFSYYTEDYQIDGFDPELIRAIGEKLGVEVEVTDYAFDALETVLRIGQVDVVIASYSITPERKDIIDFSNVYYSGQDGILAKADSQITQITSPEQMATLRIGVQEKSVYATWAQQQLVRSGIIGQDQLFVYTTPADAVNDLRLDRLDLVIMDYQPATKALEEGGLKMVGQGLNPQQYAIGVQKGAISLKNEINQALLRLQVEGKINELIIKYLGLLPEDLTPLATPDDTQLTPASDTPTQELTEETCTDSMALVEQINFKDENLTNFPKLNPGQTFNKGLRIMNTGSCTWTSAYFAKFMSGSVPEAQMQGQPTSILEEVRPGQTYDLYIDLIAPQTVGQYVGYWQLINKENVPFGQTLWIAIEVKPNTPTMTPTPTLTATPTPTIQPTATEKPGSDLIDINWVLAGYRKDIDDEDLSEPIQDLDVTLFFDDVKSILGFAGCNTYDARYVTNGKQIIFDDFVVTEVICDTPEGIMDQENIYLDLLDSTEEYRVNSDGQLELVRFITNANNQKEEKILLLFNAAKE
jgi:polar amino acid transport system substrate-binding protein